MLLEDAAALIGLVIAALGLGLALALERPVLDGVASVAIGLLLVLTAVFLARETLSLLTGESASRPVLQSVREILGADRRVASVDEILSMHLGPNEVLLAITIDLDDRLSGSQIEDAAEDLRKRVAAAHPEVTRLFLRPRRSGQPMAAPIAGA